MNRRSPNILLGVYGLLLVVCLGVVLYTHSRYTAANTVYENHLKQVVITPQSNIKAELAAEAKAANKWLLARTVASVGAAVAIGGVLWQVMRRRNQRLTGNEERTETEVV